MMITLQHRPWPLTPLITIMEYFLINSTIILLHYARTYVNDIQKKKRGKKSRSKRRLGKENSSRLWFIVADKLEQCLASSRLIRRYEISDNRDGSILRAFIHENLVRNCHRHCSRNNRNLSRLLAVIALPASAKKDVDPTDPFVEIDSGKISSSLRCSLSLFFLCKSQSRWTTRIETSFENLWDSLRI